MPGLSVGRFLVSAIQVVADATKTGRAVGQMNGLSECSQHRVGSRNLECDAD
jgi:hypothetical protein